MNHVSSRQAVVVWLFLVCATLGSAWLAEHHALAGYWTAVVVMLVALLKGQGITRYFMEMKLAPWRWRLAFELWLLIVTGLIIALWWFSRTAG